jgi:general stress protein 26
MSMSQNDTHEHGIQKLGELIQDIGVAMLTTIDDDGTLRSRPMQTQDDEFDGTLWFFTGAGSHKVLEVQHEARVNVSYAAPDKNRYVSVSGTASLVRDKAKIEEFWKPAYKAWFPQGQDDPDVALLKIDVEQAEYWDSPSSAVVHTIGFVKAVVTGQKFEPGENEKISL